MKPLDISAETRAAKHSFSALAVDDDGNEILAGLTRSESEWMIDYERVYGIPTRARSPSADDKKLHIALHEKHERARLGLIGKTLNQRS